MFRFLSFILLKTASKAAKNDFFNMFFCKENQIWRENNSQIFTD